MYFILKCPTNPHKRYFNVASAVPFVIFWNLADESLVVKKFLYWLRWSSRENSDIILTSSLTMFRWCSSRKVSFLPCTDRFHHKILTFMKISKWLQWPNHSLKIKKNNLKNQTAHLVSIDFNYPPTCLQGTDILIPLFHLEFLKMTHNKTLSLLNCELFKSYISMKQN